MEVGEDSSLYIADTNNHCIRKVNPDGTINTVAGTGTNGYNGDNRLAASAQLAWPQDVAVGTDGSLYIADTGNYRIRKVALDGTIITVAGNGTEGYSGDNGPATSAQLAWPRGVVMDADGCLYIADCGNSVIREVAPDGTITTVAGIGTEGYSGDNGPATSAELADPHGIVMGEDGSLYIGEPRNHCIRKVFASLTDDFVLRWGIVRGRLEE